MTVTIMFGDVREQLRKIPDDSMHCCVTSPPYWGLRDYGVVGQIGLESSPAEFLAVMVDVFEEVRRVLRPDGTCWINMGDSYSHGGSGARDQERWPKQERNDHMPTHAKKLSGLKPKDLCMMPHRLAIALQDVGWYVRQDIVWAKPNPMPESVTDRCTKSHEYIFLLSKSEKYYFDSDAIREPHAGKVPTKSISKSEYIPRHDGLSRPPMTMADRVYNPLGRNKRSVWTMATHPFSQAHFATFPPELPENCIKAGCPPGGTVLDPFFGAGTTGLVANRLQRNCIGIELNPSYAEMARKRIDGDSPLFSDTSICA